MVADYWRKESWVRRTALSTPTRQQWLRLSEARDELVMEVVDKLVESAVDRADNNCALVGTTDAARNRVS